MAIGPVFFDLAGSGFTRIWKYSCHLRSFFDVLGMRVHSLLKLLLGFFYCFCIHTTFSSEQIVIGTINLIILSHTLAGHQNVIMHEGTYGLTRDAYGAGLVKGVNVGLSTFSTAVYKPPFLPNLAKTLPCRFMM